MEKNQKFGDKGPGIIKKKKYSKPVLTILGKVSDLTAGGSGGATEDSAPQHPGCESNSKNKMRC